MLSGKCINKASLCKEAQRSQKVQTWTEPELGVRGQKYKQNIFIYIYV